MQVFSTESNEDLSLLLEVLSECENINGIKIVGFSYYFADGKLFSILLSSGITTIGIIVNEFTINSVSKIFQDPKWMKIGFDVNYFVNYLKCVNICTNNIFDIKNLLYSTDLKFSEEMITFDSLCGKFFDYYSELDPNETNDAYKLLYIFKSIVDPTSEFLKKKFSKKPTISRNNARNISRDNINKNTKI